MGHEIDDQTHVELPDDAGQTTVADPTIGGEFAEGSVRNILRLLFTERMDRRAAIRNQTRRDFSQRIQMVESRLHH